VVNTLREWKVRCPKTKLGLVFPTGERKRRDGSVVGGQVEYHSNIVVRGLGAAQIAAGVTSAVLRRDGKPALGADGKPVIGPKYPGLHALRHFYAS
jgi:integrase